MFRFDRADVSARYKNKQADSHNCVWNKEFARVSSTQECANQCRASRGCRAFLYGVKEGAYATRCWAASDQAACT